MLRRPLDARPGRAVRRGRPGAAGPLGHAGSTAPGLAVRVGPVAPPGPVRLVHTPELSLRPHPGGLLHLEAEDAAAAVDLHTPEPELRRWAAELLRRARRTVRGLDDARVVEYQVCVRPLPADGQSIVGRLPGAPGLYVAVTHSGVTLAAHLSRLIAADLTTGTPPAALAPYSPARFTALSPEPRPPPRNQHRGCRPVSHHQPHQPRWTARGLPVKRRAEGKPFAREAAVHLATRRGS